MTAKIKQLTIEVSEGDTLTSYTAKDETGQLRAELVVCKENSQARDSFVRECQEKADSVILPDQPEAFPLVWTPDGLQYAFGATKDSPVQANLF